MTKRRKDTRTEHAKDDRVVEGLAPPKSLSDIIGRFVPPPCPNCQRAELPNRRKTYVNGTEKIVNTQRELIIQRAIKCPHCKWTRMDYEIIKHDYLRSLLHDDGATEENSKCAVQYLEHGISGISTSTD